VLKSVLLIGAMVCLAFGPAANAQLLGGGIVYDPTQAGHAIQQISQAQQLYTTASQTRDQIVQEYNLARRMAQMPQDLYRRYAAEFARWTTLNAADSYGNTADWITAANTGAYDRAAVAVTKAGVQLVPFPASALGTLDASSQAMVKSQVATAELSDGLSTNALITLGQIRARSQALNQQISTLERDTYSTDPNQQTEMSVLGKLNAASVMQLRSQQDTNQILSTAALQQMLTAKDQFDAQKRALNQAIYFQQNFPDANSKITSGMTQSMQSISFSARPQQ